MISNELYIAIFDLIYNNVGRDLFWRLGDPAVYGPVRANSRAPPFEVGCAGCVDWASLRSWKCVRCHGSVPGVSPETLHCPAGIFRVAIILGTSDWTFLRWNVFKPNYKTGAFRPKAVWFLSGWVREYEEEFSKKEFNTIQWPTAMAVIKRCGVVTTPTTPLTPSA
jgi:hypothetical protein